MKHAPYGRERGKKALSSLHFTYKLGRTKYSKYNLVGKKRQAWNVLSFKRDITVSDLLQSPLFSKPDLLRCYSAITSIADEVSLDLYALQEQILHLAALALCLTNTCFCVHERTGVAFNPDQPAAWTKDAHGPVWQRNCVVAEWALVRPRSPWRSTTTLEIQR